MNRKIIAVMLSIAIVLTSALAWAGVFEREIADQQAKLDRGKASGKLTHREAATVQDNLNYIKHHDKGRLSEPEKEKLKSMLDRNDRMIDKMKGDGIRKVY